MTKLFKNSKSVLSFVLAFAVLAVSLFTGVVIKSDAASCSKLNVVYVTNGISADTAPTKGTGIASDPYIIENEDHLRYIAQKSTPETTYGIYYKVDDNVDIIVLQTEAYINAVAGSLDAFLALDAEGVKAALSQASVTVGESTVERTQFQSGTSGSTASDYDGFAGTIDFNGVTICGMYNANGGLISTANGGATLKNLTLCNNYITSGWYNGNLVGYVHNGSATQSEYRPLTISNVVVHDCYQYTTANGYSNTGVLVGTASNSKNIPIHISNILTYDNISLGQKSSSDTTMVDCALLGALPSGWNGSGDGVQNASYSNIVTLDCVPYPTQTINNQCTRATFYSSVYTTDVTEATPNTFDKTWSAFDITVLSSADLAKGTAAKTNMPKLDWTNTWVAIDGAYPELQAFHSFVVTDNGNGTHTTVCQDCSLVVGTVAHNFVAGVCACGYTAKCGEVILFWNGSADSTLADNGEAGTAEDPIIIDDAAELNYLVNSVSGNTAAGKLYYKMADGIDTVILQPESIATADADANGVYDILETTDIKAYYEEIGVENLANWTAKDVETWFAGTFDANNTQFVGMYAKARSVGLFPTADGGATFKNLAVVNSYIHGSKNSNDGTRTDGQSRTGAIVGGTSGYKYGVQVGGTVTFDTIVVANNYLYTERGITTVAVVLGSDNAEEAVSINNAIVYGNTGVSAEAPEASLSLTSGGGTCHAAAANNSPNDTPSIANVIVLGTAPYNSTIKGDAYFTNVYTDMDASSYTEANIKNVADLTGAELAAACDALDWADTFLATADMPTFQAFHGDSKATDNGDGTHSTKCSCGLALTSDIPHNWVDGKCAPCGAECAHDAGPDFVTTSPADCNNGTIGNVVCATCGLIFEENIPYGDAALGHDPQPSTDEADVTLIAQDWEYPNRDELLAQGYCKAIKTYCSRCNEPGEDQLVGHNPSADWQQLPQWSDPAYKGTCESDGQHTEAKICIDCWETVETRTVTDEKTGHSFDTIPAEEATCSYTGNIEYKYCVLCWNSFAMTAADDEPLANALDYADYTLDIDPDNHDWVEYGSDATCTVDGVVAHKFCTGCKVFMIGDQVSTDVVYDNAEFNEYDPETWEPVGPGAVAMANEDALYAEKQAEYLAANGLEEITDWDAWFAYWDPISAEYWNNVYHDYFLAKAEAAEIDLTIPAGHKAALNLDGSIVYSTHNGSHYKVCSVCSEEFDEETCSGDFTAQGYEGCKGICDVCGEEMNELNSHDWNHADSGSECNNCHFTCAHDAVPNFVTTSPADCNNGTFGKLVCSKGCEFVFEENAPYGDAALGHDPQPSTDEADITILAYDWFNPESVELLEQGYCKVIKTYCSRCNEPGEDQLVGHNPSADWQQLPQWSDPAYVGTCEGAGKHTEAKVCIDCWETVETRTVTDEKTGHSFDTIPAEEATCSATGNIEYKYCVLCWNSFAMTAADDEPLANALDYADYTLDIDPDNHDWVEYGSDATCTEDGVVAHKFCTGCKVFMIGDQVSTDIVYDDAEFNEYDPETWEPVGPGAVAMANEDALYAEKQAEYLAANGLEEITDWDAWFAYWDPISAEYWNNVYHDYFLAKAEAAEIDLTIAQKAHATSKHTGTAATCTAAGEKDYFTCATCTNVFEDQAATKLIENLDEWKVIPVNSAAHANITAKDAVAATTEAEGTKAHYACSCGTLFSDAEGKNTVTAESLVIAKLPAANTGADTGTSTGDGTGTSTGDGTGSTTTTPSTSGDATTGTDTGANAGAATEGETATNTDNSGDSPKTGESVASVAAVAALMGAAFVIIKKSRKA